VCKNNDTSVTVPNVTAVPNVTPAPKVLKMTKNYSSVPKMYQKATWCTYWCSVPTGVPNVTPAPNVPKMTKNHSSVPKSYLVYLLV